MTSHWRDFGWARLKRVEDKMCEGINEGLLYETSRENKMTRGNGDNFYERMPEVLSVDYVEGCALIYEINKENNSARVSVVDMDGGKDLADSTTYFIPSFAIDNVINGLNATLKEEPY